MIGVNSAIYTANPNHPSNLGISFAISLEQVDSFLSAFQQGLASRVPQRQLPIAGNQKPEKLVLNGSVVNGKLDNHSNKLTKDNSYVQLYTFKGKAGQQVAIDMSSLEVNPFLILLTPEGSLLAQSDEGGNNHARVTATLPADGTYTLIANTYKAGESGAYSLRAQAFILQLHSELSQGEQRLGDGSRYRDYTFQGQAGQSVKISLESEFDSHLLIYDPAHPETPLTKTDNKVESSKDCAIAIKLPRTGLYVVRVNANDSQGQGRYSLTVR